MAGNNAKVIMQLKAIADLEHTPLAGAEEIAKHAQRLAPVRTGFLRSKIRARKTKAKGATVEALAPYSGYVEFGTYKMPAQPFLRPAIDQHRRQILEVERRAVEAEIRGLIHR